MRADGAFFFMWGEISLYEQREVTVLSGAVEFCDGACLDLPDAFAREIELISHFFEGVCV